MTSNKPLRLVLMWHMHQPDFRDFATGEFTQPWVYLHAIKDYTDMAAHLEAVPLSLDPIHLPEYAARTTVRMLAALAVSLLFSLSYATWAAKNERAGKLLVPILDVLQSVPILGFISITVVFFLTLGRGRVLGAEMAAIFAIFTSQAWNMAFSVYQSLRTVPAELREAAD